jgi:GMP synthase (glutamine-hydrolysing)
MAGWLIVRNVESEGPGLLGNVLADEGIPYRMIDAFAGTHVPDGIAGIEGLVILGGPMGVYETERYPALAAERRLVRTAAAAGCPVLGICLGAQLLASAFGADVHPGSGQEIGWGHIELTTEGVGDPVLGSLAPGVPVFHLHGDTFDLPAGAVHLARTKQYPMQAFRIGHHAYGLQFHLEFTPEIIERVLEDPACREELQRRGDSWQRVITETRARAEALAPHADQAFRAFLRLGRGDRD